tara:strand:- start:5503 stop:6591 length:1089 start_codon:yes stop_codon:yes gene_type:complete
MKTKLIFLDRDGTMIKEPADEQIDSFAKLSFLPNLISALKRIVNETEYALVMVTNQDGLGTESFPEADFWPVQNFIIDLLAGEGIPFKAIHIDPSLPAENSPNRKPNTGMLQEYIYGNYDLANSYVIGDRLSDLALAENLNCQAIFIGEEQEKASLSSESWTEIADFLCSRPRKAKVQRATKETAIDLVLNLDGSGKAIIKTGLAFFDHMLEQIARHGDFDLELICRGDLQVDEHHTVEDVAIVLGQAFKQALGQKKGIERYSFLLPMDESEAQISLDFGGRAYLQWQCSFQRERIGDLPTEMFKHFFKSFCDAASCTLHVHSQGENEHHKIESVFKAFAKVLNQASKRNASGRIPSTKGIL